MNEHIITINPYAKLVRTDKTILTKLRLLKRRETTIVEPDSVSQLIASLNAQSKDLSKVTIYIVGGDGTFKQILNWVMTLPPEHRPSLMPVGGGEFNFMARYIGLKDTDPSKNLADIFSGRITPKPEQWRPIQVHDSYTNTNQYAAVVANGLVCSVVKLYEEQGKGNLLSVVRLVASVCGEYLKGMITGRGSRIEGAFGALTIDDKNFSEAIFAGIVLGAVTEFMPTCKPFRSNITPNTCGTIAYWGEIGLLPLAVPWLWFGKNHIAIDPWMFNGVSETTKFVTDGRHMLFDGDLFEWQNPHMIRTFTFTRGPEVTLLRAV